MGSKIGTGRPFFFRHKGRLSALVLVAGVAALLLYISFQSISLDDFDSVSFALALNHFDIALQQPQAPGFPIYVAMGDLARFVSPDARTALTAVSAIAGAVGVAALLWFGAELGNLTTGLLAALWLMTLPGYWLPSEMALSDVPGVALIILAVGCLWKGRNKWRWLVAGTAMSGLCLGLRPQNGIPVLIFGVYTLAIQCHQLTLLQVATIIAVGLISVLAWLVPTVSVSGGLDRYLSLVQAHSQHVLQVDSLFGHPVDGAAVSARIAAFGNGLLQLVGGQPGVALLTAAILVIGLARVHWRSAAALLCGVWLITVAVQVFFLESLERPRLYLPFIPPLILLAASGWTRGFPQRRYMLAVPLLLAGIFAFTTLPLAQTLSREATPPVQATAYIAAHYSPDKTIIVTQGSYRHVQWELPAYRNIYLDSPDVTSLARPVATSQPTYLVLLDRDGIWPEAYTALTETSDYVPIEDMVFSRDPRVFPQHDLVRMQVLTPLSLVTADQLAPPSSGIIQVGDPVNGKYFEDGWYRVEDIGGVSARWTQQVSVMRVALSPRDTMLTIEAAPYPPDQSVEIIVNGRSVGTLKLIGNWQAATLKIPGSVLAGQSISTIQFKHSHAGTPPDSNRSLASAYRTITFAPSP